ncbi:MAG: energy-coupling factor transporter ATPase [Lachnospiraceae bacterium]|nr:energy-coupling factor transporter ATPase [Lachnospiraceae bacterium]
MAIRLEHVSHIYNEGTPMERVALNDVSLEINDGEFIGLVGHTGSGKSTLIQHLDGLLRATSGKIYYNDEDIYREHYPMRELRGKVGLVFQYPEHQLFEADIFTDVCFGPKNLKLSKEEIESRAKEALEAVGMDESYYRRSPFELSGGQKRRVAIAGVLAMKPEVLVLDEPTAGLDPKGREEILQEIRSLNEEQGITIVLVSHSMEDVARYAKRMIVMNKGSVMFDGTPAEVFAHHRYELEDIGLGVPQVTRVMESLEKAGIPVKTGAITLDEAETEIARVFGLN